MALGSITVKNPFGGVGSNAVYLRVVEWHNYAWPVNICRVKVGVYLDRDACVAGAKPVRTKEITFDETKENKGQLQVALKQLTAVDFGDLDDPDIVDLSQASDESEPDE